MIYGKIGVLLADIHMGAIDPEEMKSQLREYVIKPLYENNPDFIIILGDYWDKKLYLNDSSVSVGVWFMNKLIEICKTIRIVYGTESHEVNQYKSIFGYLENDPDIDMKIIYSVTEEELFGMNILYLPEEYISDKDIYYSEFFNKKKYYDYIFGHGVIAEAMTMIKRSKNKEKEKRLKPATFTTADFKKCCKGEVYFGHYHIHSNINDKVFYVGSFTRWLHGEEESKGYMKISYNPDNDNPYYHEFIENYDAKVYKTYSFGYDDSLFDTGVTIDGWITTLNNILDLYPNGKIRFIINIPETYENPEFLMKSIREFIQDKENVSCDFVNGYIEKQKKVNTKVLNEVIEKYDYILNKNLPVGEIVNIFIKEKNGREIGGDKVETYLHTDVMKLIEEEMNQ